MFKNYLAIYDQLVSVLAMTSLRRSGSAGEAGKKAWVKEGGLG